MSRAAKPIVRNRAAAVRSRMAIRRAVLAALKECKVLATSSLVKADTSADKRAKSIVKQVFNDDLFDTFGGLIEAISLNAVASAAAQIGVDASDVLSQANERAVKYAKERGGRLIRLDGDVSIAETTRAGIADLIAMAEQDGWSNDRLSKELSESYLFSRERADVIARTETAAADVEGNVSLYIEAGVEKLEWVTAEDDKVSDLCLANDREIRAIGESFPSGATQPPQHPNCRCDVLPV